MDYYDNEAEYAGRGIDYDLGACLTYNTQDGFGLEDIDRVLAVWQGENDGDDWRWILRLKDARIIFLRGGCDYTGWDCQSSARHWICENIAAAIDNARTSEYGENTADVVLSLAKQLIDGKALTWHEQTGKDLGLRP